MIRHERRYRAEAPLTASCCSLTEHPEVSFALRASSHHPVDLAEELLLVGEASFLDDESGCPFVRSDLDAAAVVRVVVHHCLTVVTVEDARPGAAADASLQQRYRDCRRIPRIFRRACQSEVWSDTAPWWFGEG